MKTVPSFSRCLLKPVASLLVFAAFGGFLIHAANSPSIATNRTTTVNSSEIDFLKSEIAILKSKLPDQSHVMKDVGYHFANLWFAARESNWPLAQFYLDETRSHLKWAVRIIPVRQTKAGPVQLGAILDAVDHTLLANVNASIQAKDHKKFEEAYRAAIEGCYSCHKASEKPYIRPQIPSEPEAKMVNFDPAATWPQ